MDPPIFVSYASENRLDKSERDLFDSFVQDLERELALLLGTSTGKLVFLAHRDIETGDEWPPALARALCSARVMLYFGSRHYFNSHWCGREFEVFRRRRSEWIGAHAGRQAAPVAIVPVQWIPTDPPDVSSAFQYTDAAFPPSYKDLGLRKLLQLNRKDEWLAVLTALTGRLKRAIEEPGLAPLAKLLPVHQLPSAFHVTPSAGAGAGTAALPSPGNAAYFVFVAATRTEIAAVRADVSAWGATDGWDWRPFHPQSPESVGATAQRAAGDRNLRFVQLECNGRLMDRLREAKRARAPVVIFADPWSARLTAYRNLLSDYDDLNLMNCAVLVPWNRDDPETAADEAGLLANLRRVCMQKISQRYAGHYWNIASNDDFRARALTVLDEITLRMLEAAGSDDVRRAESADLAAAALEQGIRTDAQPHLRVTVDDDR